MFSDDEPDRGPPVSTPRRTLLKLLAVCLLPASSGRAAGTDAASSARPLTISSDSWTQVAELVPTGGIGRSRGEFLALENDTALVGAEESTVSSDNDGAAYVFERTEDDWTETQVLSGNDGDTDSFFDGFGPVALDGDTAFVAAPIYIVDGGAEGAGKVYVFESVEGEWTQTQQLTASDFDEEHVFGGAVALEGDTAIVGSPFDNTGDETAKGFGSAYVFEYDGTEWVETQKIILSNPGGSDRFGDSVAIDGDVALITAPGRDNETSSLTGAVYVFELVDGEWVDVQRFTRSDAVDFEGFGDALALDGNRALVGSTDAHDGDGNNTGAAHVFEYDGTEWVETQRLTASDGDDGDGFGASVELVGDLALVGAPRKDDGTTSSAGAVYVFEFNGSEWVETEKLTPEQSTEFEAFGTALALSSDTILAGGTDDVVYVFARREQPPAIGQFQNPPRDLDGDGTYEDINGDGEFNIVDVQALFVNLDDPVLQDYPSAFDFNGDGSVNVVDVQALFVALFA